MLIVVLQENPGLKVPGLFAMFGFASSFFLLLIFLFFKWFPFSVDSLKGKNFSYELLMI